MRTIYHIEYAKNGDIAASWWEVCMLENINFLLSQWEKNCILTTEKWKKAFLDWWLKETELLSFITIDSEDPSSRLQLLLNYFKRLFLAKKSIESINFTDNDIVFCHSDFFPNSIPLYWIFKKNKNLQFFYFFHVQAPRLFYGFKWEFLNKIHFPNIFFLYYKLNQWLYIFLINLIRSGNIIVVNPYYKNFLEKNINKNINKYYLKVFWWVSDLRTDYEILKKYDCVWMGRFQDLKWVKEIFDIAQHLKKKKSNIKIVVIGGGNQESENEFRENIKKFWLENNIDYKWFLNGKERFEIISSAKIFMMTSYFEGRPISMLESLKIWTPIVSYDLPVYELYDKGIIKVNILDNEIFSEKILEILENDDLYKKLSEDAMNFSKNYSWENTGKEIYNLIK